MNWYQTRRPRPRVPDTQYLVGMLAITTEQRDFANRHLEIAQRALSALAERGRNLTQEARAAIDSGRESISVAESAIANQPAA